MKVMFIGARLFEDVALYTKKLGITSVLTESNPESPNYDLADIRYIVPRGMEGPKNVALKEDVDAVVPLIGVDDPLLELAAFKKELEGDYGIPVVASPLKAAAVCQDKIKTKKFLVDHKFPTPASELINQKSAIADNFPVVLKQAHGQGGSGIKIVKDLEETREYLKMYGSAMAEEFLDGIEISVEVLGWKGKYVSLVPVYKGETTLKGTHPLDKLKKAPLNIDGVDNQSNNKAIRELVTEIAIMLGIEGCADFDLIFNREENLVLEINTRPSGTRYLTAASCGVNPVQQLIDMATGKWKLSRVQSNLEKFCAMEVPVGDFPSDRNSYKFREFHENNSWIIHGPSTFQRITIRGKTMKDVLNTARKLDINLK
jgi:carbamoylphosphate synthase large subunit